MRKFMMGLSVSLLFLGLVEAVLRVTMGPPSAAVQVYSGTRSHTAWFQEQNRRVTATYQHRSTGSFPTHSRQARFAVLGGSSVHGGTMNVGHRGEFPNLLAQKTRVQGLNLGNPSLDSHDLLQIIDELRGYPMDAWVIYTGHNDFGNTYFHQRYKGWSGTTSAHVQGFLEGLCLFASLRKAIGLARGNTAKPNPKKQFSGPKIEKSQKIRALNYFKRNMDRIVWLAKSEGVPLVLVVPIRDLRRAPLGDCGDESPCAVEIYDEAISMLESDPKGAWDRLKQASDADRIPLRISSDAQAYLRSIAQEGVTVVDLPNLLADEQGILPEGLFQDHVHLRPDGHRVVAQALAPFLTKALNSAADVQKDSVGIQ
ncbi:MAG: GDSL-type esterase/lipase family protein [Myxococcota bacterium]|nr:GDSL-type esterase/lipase family protein [Myxococcota bacterium]